MGICGGAAVHESALSAENIFVIGDVDEYNAREFQDLLESVLSIGRPITVDLTRCRYIGSVGLRALLDAQRRAVHFETLVIAESIAARLMEIAKVERRLGVRYVSRAYTGSISSEETTREYVRIITLDGEWDLSRGNELRRRTERALAHARVIIDLSNVSFIDSYCVGMLVRLRTQRVAKGYEPSRLVLPGGNVRRVLGIIGAHSLWTICDTLDEALRGWKVPGNIPVAGRT